uniref:Uncharacterized protein n=1 Tax=Cacopsylla melanoneura TaxID=428564 RepID=A0A8D9FBL1_9HEMI
MLPNLHCTEVKLCALKCHTCRCKQNNCQSVTMATVVKSRIICEPKSRHLPLWLFSKISICSFFFSSFRVSSDVNRKPVFILCLIVVVSLLLSKIDRIGSARVF